jgi:hypothetical protein
VFAVSVTVADWTAEVVKDVKELSGTLVTASLVVTNVSIVCVETSVVVVVLVLVLADG